MIPLAKPYDGAFTLIELLIVVAIIAILAAIAVPNFLEAQTRAKVSRIRSDLRTLATGLEVFHVDNNSYPPAPAFGGPALTWKVTTPIAYISNVPPDIFVPNGGTAPPDDPFGIDGIYLHYLNDRALLGEYWIEFSFGPDKDRENSTVYYDPTNGTISDGDLYRVGAGQ
jgi:prepilin-type N-terminal cleavage/methylation domain-containing protein